MRDSILPRVTALAGVALVGCTCFAAVAPTDVASRVQADIAANTVRDDVFPHTVAHFPDDIQGQPDIEYANLMGFRPLQLDLYMHEEPPGAPARPLVIWIHGGGWSRGDSRISGAYANFPAVLASLAARGYVVASINYRLSGEARFPAAVQDVKAAIRHLRTHAARFGIDPTRVVLWGGSAGGHLAALAATTCGLKSFEPQPSTGRFPRAMAQAPDSDTSDCVQGVVVWYGIFDLTALADPAWRGTEPTSSASTLKNVSDFLGCPPRSCPDLAELASPLTHVGPSSPPMLLIHGTDDRTVPVRQTEVMAERLRKAGVPVETVLIPDVDHGWIGHDPQATREASLRALERTFEYIHELTAADSALSRRIAAGERH